MPNGQRRDTSGSPSFQLDLQPTRLREVVAESNELVLAARERLIRNNRKVGGATVCERYARDMDVVVNSVCKWLVEEAGLSPEEYERVAIVAQGGYGRGQLNLYSDLDLLMLLPEGAKPVEQAFVTSLQYVLWDVKIDVLPITKTVTEAVAAIGNDLHSTTALVHTRLITGSQELLEQLRTRFKAAITSSGRKWFTEAKLEELRMRHEKAGRSVYLLEPNIKDGEGGLRDVHSLHWLAYVLLGSSNLDTFVVNEVLTEQERLKIVTGLDFLLQVRNVLHEVEGRKVDLLASHRQPAVAAALGYKQDAQYLGEEKMMKEYYRHARTIHRYGQKATRILTFRARTFTGGMIEAMQRRPIDEHYYTRAGVVFMKSPSLEFFQEDPTRVIECFSVAAKAGLVLSDELKDMLIAARAYTDNEAFRTSTRNRDLFMSILGLKKAAAQSIHAMHETEVLADYMPEFRKLFCLVRIDHYHRYTVDEHLIKTIEISEALVNGESDERPELVQAAREIPRWDLLNLSLLLHDIGKGEGHGHVLRGAILSQKMTQRMGLPPADQETVRQLILLHLKMSHVSQRRDLDDPHSISEMAAAVPDANLLRMLYVLTYCDTRAVGPSAWNDWKAALLTDLYRKTLLALRGYNPVLVVDAQTVGRFAAEIQEELGEKFPRAEIEQFLANVPPKYLASETAEGAAKHLLMIRQLTPENRVVWELEDPPGMNHTELTAVSYDVPGFLSMVCRALSSKAVNIRTVQVFSTTDGFAIDTFQVTDLRENKLPPGFRLDRLRQDLNSVLRGKAKHQEVFVPPKPRRPFRGDLPMLRPTEVLVDNEGSPNQTIIEVKTYDRPGLLYQITRTLAEHKCYIHSALITTEAYRVVDVFYITDLESNKLEGNDLKRLQKSLESVAKGEETPAVTPTPRT